MGKTGEKNHEECQSVIRNRITWDAMFCQSLSSPPPQPEVPSRAGTATDIFISVFQCLAHSQCSTDITAPNGVRGGGKGILPVTAVPHLFFRVKDTCTKGLRDSAGGRRTSAYRPGLQSPRDQAWRLPLHSGAIPGTICKAHGLGAAVLSSVRWKWEQIMSC